jgi:hypothetical protein
MPKPVMRLILYDPHTGRNASEKKQSGSVTVFKYRISQQYSIGIFTMYSKEEEGTTKSRVPARMFSRQ